MTRKLHISSVTISNFGGITTTRRLELPDHGLVVVEGPNESGKSTFAEAIAWLIAGPGPSKSEVARFGNKGSQLRAKAEGRLGDDALVIDSQFTYLTNLVRRSDSHLAVGGTTFDDTSFQQLVGLPTAIRFHQVYRLDGAVSHGDADAEGALEIAGAGAYGPVNPLDVADDLAKHAKTVGTSTAKTTKDSVAKQEAELDGLKADLREASNNVDEYGDGLAQLESMRDRVATLQSTLAELRTQAALFGTAKTVASRQARLKVLRADHEGADDEPEEWGPVVDRLADLEAAHDELERRAVDLRSRIATGEQAARASGLTTDRLQSLPTDGLVATAMKLATAVRNRRDELGRVESDLAQTAATTAQHESDLDRAARTIGSEATTASSDRVPLTVDQQARLVSLADRAENLAQTARGQHSAAVTARADVAAANEQLAAAAAIFERFGTGVDAEQFVRGAAISPQALQAAPRGGRWWLGPAALAGVAVAALVVGQPVLAAFAGVAAVVVGAVGAVGSSATSGPAPGPAGPVTDPALDAAQQVLMLRAGLPALEDQAAAAERQAQSDATAAAQAADTLREALAAHGLPSAMALGAVRAQVPAWSALWAATTGLRTEAQRCEQLERQQRELTVSLDRALLALRELLEPLGVPAEGDAETVVRHVDAVVEAANSARDAGSARVELDALERRVRDLIAGAVALPDGPEMIAATSHAIRTAVELRDARIERAKQDDDIRSLDQEIRTDLASSAELETLLSLHPDAASLTREEEAVNARIAQREEELGAATTEIGATEQSLGQLADAQRVSDLNDQISAAEARADELALEAVVHAVAAALVREEAKREEETRRPLLVERTSTIATSVAEDWQVVEPVRPTGNERGVRLRVRYRDGREVMSHQLSTGARTLIYLALRIAVADRLTEQTDVALPLLCDDPLVNVDPARAPAVAGVLAAAAKRRQVIVTTCHPATAELMERLGGQRVKVPGDLAGMRRNEEGA